jgi:hypothetical protein
MAIDRSNEEDVQFERLNHDDFYSTGEARGINPERWDRAKEEIPFTDVVEEMTGQNAIKGGFIRCPFHTDKTPSFKIYHNNSGYCFSCTTAFDSVKLVAQSLSLSRVKALQWLEEKYNLPKLADVIIEDEDLTGEEYTLKIKDLKPAYFKLAIEDIRKYKDPALAEEYLRAYFEALSLESPLPIARVLGVEAIQGIAEQMGLE